MERGRGDLGLGDLDGRSGQQILHGRAGILLHGRLQPAVGLLQRADAQRLQHPGGRLVALRLGAAGHRPHRGHVPVEGGARLGAEGGRAAVLELGQLAVGVRELQGAQVERQAGQEQVLLEVLRGALGGVRGLLLQPPQLGRLGLHADAVQHLGLFALPALPGQLAVQRHQPELPQPLHALGGHAQQPVVPGPGGQRDRQLVGIRHDRQPTSDPAARGAT
jgi:hypothetical protein